MEPEKTPQPKKSDGPDPFITKAERPDLTVNLNTKVGDLTVRDLQTLLGGGGASPAKLKEFLIEKPIARSQGPQGPQGHQGLQGPQRPQGPQGHQRPQGH